MTVRKQILTSMPRCYSCVPMAVHGKPGVLFATEGEGPCVRFAAPDFATPEVVWSEPGGTMSMVPLPGADGEFLAVQKFFRMYQWEEAKLVWVRPPLQPGEAWRVTDLVTLPYLHRFDVLEGADGTRYVVAATLAEAKDSKDDWSRPGCIWRGELPASPDEPLILRVLRHGITQNHGYCRATWRGRASGLFTGREGVFAVTPPAKRGAEWTVEHVLTCPVSDVAVADIDGDGEAELATLDPFHGNTFRIWKKKNESWSPVFEHPDHSEFYHAVWGGMLDGAPAFIGGCRRGSQALFVVRCTGTEPLDFTCTVLEEGVGPSNVAVFPAAENGTGHDIILSANREIAQAALYHLE